MPQQVTIDDSINRTEGGQRSIRVPEGEYLFECVGVKSMDKEPYDRLANDPDHWPFVWFQLRIKEGLGGHGQVIRQVGSLKPESMFGIGRMCMLLGFDQSKLGGQQLTDYGRLSAFAAFLEKQLVNKPVGGSVADNTGTNARTGQIQSYSNIVELYPAGEFAERSKANAFAAPRPAGASSTNGPPPAADQAALMQDIGNLF